MLGPSYLQRSNMTIAPKLSFDFKDLRCPMPVVKMAQALKQVQIGDEVEGISSDPGVMADIPAWAKATGNEVVCIEQRGDAYHFVVRRWK
jgi:tRNA 2-thiouridine synthesizing protein A